MSFKIAIASGKGGTGKTTLSVNLFHHLIKLAPVPVRLVDCDVEEPNDLIFFPDADIENEYPVSREIPFIDIEKCSFCRKCAEYCEFNAIVVIPPARFAQVNASLCHSCGACSVACEDGAISETADSIGTIRHWTTDIFGRISEGRLKIGSAMQTMMIRELKKSIPDEDNLIIYDAPPGTSCPVVETVSDADYIILVTEPTPFGLYDLKITVDLIREMKQPFGIIINKSNLGSQQVYNFIEQEGIELLGEIPFSREYAGKYASGNLFNDVPVEITKAYTRIIEKLMAKTTQYEGDHYLKR